MIPGIGRPATAAALALLGATATLAAAEPDARVMVPGSGSAAEAQVQVLRGSAIAPREAETEPPAAARLQVSTGKRLWLVDLEGGRAITCRLRDTSTVGVERIDCTRGRLPRPLLR